MFKKLWASPYARWFLLAIVVLSMGTTLALGWPMLFVMAFPNMIALFISWKQPGVAKVAPTPFRWRANYRPRNPDAGRWLEAPVAELDKSTFGKLLASRASRDPSLHVVVGSSPPPVSTDALYDREIDG